MLHYYKPLSVPDKRKLFLHVELMLFLLVHINDEELQFRMEVVFWPQSVPGGMSADGIQG